MCTSKSKQLLFIFDILDRTLHLKSYYHGDGNIGENFNLWKSVQAFNAVSLYDSLCIKIVRKNCRVISSLRSGLIHSQEKVVGK